MKKSDPSNSLPILNESSWEDNPLIQWLFQYSRYLLWILLGAIILLWAIYRFAAGNHTTIEKDYLEANRLFQTFAGATSGEAAAGQTALDNLQTILEKHPEWQAKYDGLIAQVLINQGDASRASDYANRAFNRTSADSPYYTTYSQTTLLIGQKKFQEALSEAQTLQQQLVEKKTEQMGPILTAFNLWRIALLQQELGLKKEELQTWQEWKEFYNKNRSSFLDEMIANFTEGKVSVVDYVEARESMLKKY